MTTITSDLVIMNIELEPSFVDRCLHFSSVECNSGVHNKLCLVVGETDWCFCKVSIPVYIWVWGAWNSDFSTYLLTPVIALRFFLYF